ncbi:hypothetical protein ACJ41O_010624 [Fusarium nematophilum]
MALPSQPKWRSLLNKQQAETPAGSAERVHGLHTLIDQGQDVAEAIDVVAIHGLNGHYFKTWTDSATQFNWLRDAVPTVLPKARVMSFSYDSALQFSKSASDIFDFADQLLEFLLAERRSSIEQARPIVFICHSLGGIVFKQGMIRAFERERYTALLRKTIGVMFLATPHRGSAYANWARILARILKYAGRRMKTQLSKDLEPKSRVLEQISRSFVERTEAMTIVSFYETSKLDYASAVIVEKESACLGLRNETLIPLNGNHRTICKYRAENHGDLRIILRNLECLCTADQRSQSQQQQQPLSGGEPPVVTQISQHQSNLLNRLETSSPEIHKARNPPAAKGTCTWILRHATYQSWYANPHSSFLWLSADPGCGKSVLASFLIDHFSSMEPSERPNVCYFFFKSDNAEQKDAFHALQAILRQLLLQCQRLVRVVSPGPNERRLDSLHDLWKAFVRLCHRQKLLAGLISTHFSGTISDTTMSQKSARLKLLVASRPDTAFKVLFDKSSRQPESRGSEGSEGSERRRPQASMIRLRGEDEIEAITDDVSVVIKSDMEELEHQGLPSDALVNIQEQLIARADRTFLWVTLILNLLKERVEAGASRRELDDILQSRDIDMVYSQLLSGRADAPRARKLLNLVLAAHRPLTVEELSIGLAIEGETYRGRPASSSTLAESLANFDKVEDALIFPYENHIKSLCGHFVRIIRNRVYLVHETARSFLLVRATGKQPGPVYGSVQWQGTFEMRTAHRLLLDICVAYLYCFGRRSRCARFGHASPRTRPFIEYAAAYWPMHYKKLFSGGAGLDERERSYYYNVCHPNFPGFEQWAPKALGIPIEAITPANSGISVDDIQDFCCSHLLTEVDGKIPGELDPGRSDLASNPWAFSSNPGALSNHNFPLKVDEYGAVRLDFSKGPQNKRR